jgi:GT2 family glycosyltransferase/glycosyltransferase involved in cell wall biosynthesis
LGRQRPGRLASADLKLPLQVKVAFTSGTDDLNAQLVGRMRELLPELPLFVVAEFPPGAPDVIWVPYHVNRNFRENWARCRAVLAGKSVRLAGVLLVPNVPYRRLRLLAFLLAPLQIVAFNENLNHWMLRPRCAWTIARHFAWRMRNFLRWHFGRDGTLARRDWPSDFWYAAARVSGWLRARRGFPTRSESDCGNAADASLEPGISLGISLVIPSRNGKELLAAQLPGILRDLPSPAEIIVVDNGSDDGTAFWLNTTWPQIRVETSELPLSFAAAVNRGIARARSARVCLLNNDMLVEPGFFAALEQAFARVPDLFCATAQIKFPAGVRREETGKAVMAQTQPTDFPIRCDIPLPGEDLTYVLYGSGGCSLYDAQKLRALGAIDESYAPAYVEDLDLGYRAWQRGWPSVYVAGAVVEHRHRATTSRYYSEQELARILERNYLQFLAGAVHDRALFQKLWAQATGRLWLLGDRASLRTAASAPLRSRLRTRSEPRPSGSGCGTSAAPGALSETAFLALTSGAVSVFAGQAASGKPRVLIASPYLLFPLAHGGAVRMYNLMRRAAEEFDQILVVFSETAAPPAPEILAISVETVLVRRPGTHSLPFTGRPDVVEEFASPSFRAALQQSVRKWRPAIVQLEFTQMAQYASCIASGACAPAKTILVEHDITFELYEQLLAIEENWDLRRQLALWRQFETAAWREVTCVVTMSEKDRALVSGTATALPNGVDLERFQPSSTQPDPGRLLFIGSFAHLPNLLAAEFFLTKVWPCLLNIPGATLHIIAGDRHQYHLARAADRVKLPLDQPSLEVEGFVSDVRPAYRRAAVVVAPLVASAGTNIKILEAMAMGKAVVSTRAGVTGLDLVPGEDFVLAQTAVAIAEAIADLLRDPAKRKRLETAARLRVERDYGWDEIARRQTQLYRDLL